jgi:hypothetical protein
MYDPTATHEMADALLTSSPSTTGGSRPMTPYSTRTTTPAPIGYARGYEIDPAAEEAIFTDPLGGAGMQQRSALRYKKPVQVVRRGDLVFVVDPSAARPSRKERGLPRVDRHLSSSSQQPRRATTAPAARRAYRPDVSAQDTEDLPVIHKERKHPHWLLPAGVGGAVMLGLVLGISSLFGWVSTTLDDLHYGHPRTYQTDARVGHNDSVTPSHFLAINLNRHVEIIELPGSDASHARVYQGPVLTGEGQQDAPVLLSFKDVNHDGKPDLVASVQQARIVLVNTGKAFRPATLADHVTL